MNKLLFKLKFNKLCTRGGTFFKINFFSYFCLKMSRKYKKFGFIYQFYENVKFIIPIISSRPTNILFRDKVYLCNNTNNN